jgi:hypothetical protein
MIMSRNLSATCLANGTRRESAGWLAAWLLAAFFFWANGRFRLTESDCKTRFPASGRKIET